MKRSTPEDIQRAFDELVERIQESARRDAAALEEFRVQMREDFARARRRIW